MPHADAGFSKLFDEVRAILRGPGARDERLLAVCALLKERVRYYDWVGFYLREDAVVGASRRVGTVPVLILGPYVGAPTEHTRIAFGRGICGQAAERKQTFVVPDVSKERNYLSCGAEVKSEIVVPILKGADVAGELDIDSHALAPFTVADRVFLERVAAEVANVL